MTQKYISLVLGRILLVSQPREQFEFFDFKLSVVIYTSQRVIIVRELLVITALEVSVAFDSADAAYCKDLVSNLQINYTAEAEEKYVWSHPASMIKSLVQVARFMVSSNKNSEHGCHQLSRVIPMKVPHMPVLGRTAHGLQINFIPHCLEVSAAKQNMHLSMLAHPFFQLSVHLYVVAMQTANVGNPYSIQLLDLKHFFLGALHFQIK